MKRLLSLAGLFVVAACSDSATPAGLASDGVSLGPVMMFAKNGVAVCHVTGNGKYNLLNIAGAALPAHMAHGDGQPGQGAFSSDCVLVAVTINIGDGDIDWYGGQVDFTIAPARLPSGVEFFIVDDDGVIATASVSVENGSGSGEFPPCKNFGIIAVLGETTVGQTGILTSECH